MPQARSASAASRRRITPPRPKRVISRDHVRRVRWDRVGRVALVVVLVVVAGLYAQDAMTYLSTRGQADQQQAIVKRLQRENATLAKQQQSLHDPATIERAARSLGMVLPGERPYVMMGGRSNH
jgi:cell division protein FtsL